MNQTVHNPEPYDFRQYDRIWQRVAPNLEPYPGMCAMSGVSPAAEPGMAGPAVPAQPVTPAGPAQPVTPAMPAQPVIPPQAGLLPGADANPCCMGTAAAEMLDVLTGYIEDAHSDRRAILALVRIAPGWARQRLRDIAAELGEQAKRLMAAHYLITGNCYRPSVAGTAPRPDRWCPALRERYHAAACAGLNYARSADDTNDPCLARLLNDLSAASYRHADALMRLLERGLS